MPTLISSIKRIFKAAVLNVKDSIRKTWPLFPIMIVVPILTFVMYRAGGSIEPILWISGLVWSLSTFFVMLFPWR